jgi:hypothetical protein
VQQSLAQAYFQEAQLYCDNTLTSPIADDTVGGARSLFLNMVVAHIAQLNAAINGQPASPIVGRINNATEGSVTVASENLYPPGTVQWWQQTRYGAAFWAATQQYRKMYYAQGYPRIVDPYAPYVNGY